MGLMAIEGLLDGVDQIGAGDRGLLVSPRAAGAARRCRSSSSFVPTMTATAAPLRSATFIWLFMLRFS